MSEHFQPLTERQMEVFNFMVEFFEEEDRMPNTREIQRRFNWRSQTASVNVLHAIAAKGWIEYRQSLLRGGKGWWRFSRHV